MEFNIADLPEEARKALEELSEEEVNNKIQEAQTLLHDFTDVLIAAMALYTLDSRKRRKNFTEWVRRQDDGGQLFTILSTIPEDQLMTVVHKIITESYMRIDVRKRISAQGIKDTDILFPLVVPTVRRSNKESSKKTDPPTGMYL